MSDGTLASWAQEIVDVLASYSELSPSGAGLHIIVKGKVPRGRGRSKQIEMSRLLAWSVWLESRLSQRVTETGKINNPCFAYSPLSDNA